MQYKLYTYDISDRQERLIAPDRHFSLFEKSKGRDAYGQHTRYRGKNDAILMAVRSFRSDFSGLIGRHATEREVTEYNEALDEATQALLEDDDYPNTIFVCFPRLGTIACIEGTIKSDSALARLHAILIHRQDVYFTYKSLTEPIDLRKATKRFKVTEVTFEILPVNPHTGPLGRELDANRAKDHVRRLKGKAEGTTANPIKLNGGIMSAVQELQQSGHAKVGFKGSTSDGVEVIVPKPADAHELAANENDVVHGEDVAVKVNFPNLRFQYPLGQGHITNLRAIIKALKDPQDE